MASSSFNSISILSLLLLIITFATTSPLGHSLIIDGLSVAQIQIQGLVSCSSTGNPKTTGTHLPAAGVPVSGMCNGASGTIFTAVTNTTGFFSALITAIDGILFHNSVLPCYALVQLPVTGTSCMAFLPTGVLQAPVTLVGTVENLLGGIIAVFKAGEFKHLTV